MPFPLMGLNKVVSIAKQPQLTSGYLNNVRPFDVLEGRARGGQRPGLDKIFSTQIGGATTPVVALCQVGIPQL